MFRKPKNAGKKAAFRKRGLEKDEGGDNNEDGDSGPSRPSKAFRKRSGDSSSSDEDNGGAAGDGGESTSDLLEQIRRDKEGKKSKKRRVGGGDDEDGDGDGASKPSGVMHEFGTQEERLTASDLATRTAEHHPTAITRGATASATDKDGDNKQSSSGGDGVYRGQSQTRNKFLAGPIKAPSFVRTTCRFDYQPDICKDYKDTGFCGFGDTCIYLHDRGDTMAGWQLEQQWEEKKKKEREDKEREMEKFLASAAGDGQGDGDNDEAGAIAEDGLPFACHICRSPFDEPVVTTCGHYFCQRCIMDKVRGGDASCPICGKDTHGVFNHPSKLVSKKRRVVGSKATWQEFAEAARKGASEED